MGKVESEIPAFLTSIRLAQRVTPMVNLPKSTVIPTVVERSPLKIRLNSVRNGIVPTPKSNVIPNEVRDLRLLLRKNR
jgi:hypothetical protein